MLSWSSTTDEAGSTGETCLVVESLIKVLTELCGSVSVSEGCLRRLTPAVLLKYDCTRVKDVGWFECLLLHTLLHISHWMGLAVVSAGTPDPARSRTSKECTQKQEDLSQDASWKKAPQDKPTVDVRWTRTSPPQGAQQSTYIREATIANYHHRMEKGQS